VIALWLGHENVETTQVYLHADLEIRERALAKTRQHLPKPGPADSAQRTSFLPSWRRCRVFHSDHRLPGQFGGGGQHNPERGIMHAAALNRNLAPQRGKSLVEARPAVDDNQFRRLQAASHEVVKKRPPSRLALSAHVLDRQQNFLAVGADAKRQAPSATSSEIDVAFLSNRTRTTVPSRINRMIGSSASERAFHETQPLLTLRQARLTVSLPTAPPNTEASARCTRRVLVPGR